MTLHVHDWSDWFLSDAEGPFFPQIMICECRSCKGRMIRDATDGELEAFGYTELMDRVMRMDFPLLTGPPEQDDVSFMAWYIDSLREVIAELKAHVHCDKDPIECSYEALQGEYDNLKWQYGELMLKYKKAMEVLAQLPGTFDL